MQRSFRLGCQLLLGASVSAISLGAGAFAQDVEDTGVSEVRRLNTVEVTATRREGTTVQDVPIAVTALTSEDLDRAGVLDIRNLQSLSASFNLNSSNSESAGTTLRIRGVGTTGNNIGLESAVGVFLDGVYLSRPGIALADLLDVEQIEILRGPQGTLFGRNTSAGALSIETKRPDLNEFSGFTNLTAGDYDLFNVQAGLNIPVIEDKFGIRVSGAIRMREGFATNFDGDDMNTRDRLTLRGQGLYDAGEYGIFRVIGDYAEGNDLCCDAVWATDRSATNFAAFGLPADGGAPNVGNAAVDDFKTNGTENANPFEQWGASLTYENDIGFADFTYIGSYRYYNSDGTFRDSDATGLDIITFGPSPDAKATGNFATTDGDIITLTHEARLQGIALDGRLDWLVGAYYSDEEIDAANSLTMLSDYQAAVSGGLLGALAASQPNPLFNTAGGVDADGDYAFNQFLQDAQSFSVFTHNVFYVTDKLNLTVGLRYVEESKEASWEQLDGEHDACIGTLAAGAGNFLGSTGVALNCFFASAPSLDRLQELNPAAAANPLAFVFLGTEYDGLKFEDDHLVYTLKAGYAFNDDVNVYGGFTHGFKSGGFNLDPSATAGGADPRFDSEKVDAWEAGVKATVLDGRGVINAAIFHQDMEDFQVLEFTGTRFQTFNVEKVKSTGFEVETQAQLTRNLGASLGVTYTDARYPSDCTTTDPADPDYFANAASLCGQTLTNAPEWVTILGGSWQQPVANGRADLFINGSWRSVSETRTSTQAVEVSNPDILLQSDIQEAYSKVNLRIGLASPDQRWIIEVWGDNITDERTKNLTFSVPLRGGTGDRARAQYMEDPATFGVTLRTKF